MKGVGMFEVGEYIVHPGQGVCKVVDVGEGPSAAYKLLPLGQRHALLISFPVSGEDRLRPVVSHDDALALIDGCASIGTDDFTGRSAALEEEHFKDVMRHGSCRDSMRVAKTFRRRIAKVREQNKKPPVAYERILKEAQRRSLSELACALDATTDEVRELLMQHDPEYAADQA